MIDDLLLGIGLVAIVEGLALAPAHLREVLEMVAHMNPDVRRTLGLLAVTAGVGLVWLGRG